MIRKWAKRLLLATAILLVGLIVLAAVGYHYVHGNPQFYKRYQWDENQRSIISQRTVDKLSAAHNLAARTTADERAAARRTSATLPNRAPAQPVTIKFTEEELNAFLLNHVLAGFPAAEQVYGRHFSDVGLFLHERELIFATRMEDMGNILLALHFAPSMDDHAQLRLDFKGASAGRLSLPSVILGRYTGLVREGILQRLPQWQRWAQMKPTGESNASTVAAAMGKLLLHALRNEPAEPVIFVPTMSGGDAVPLLITQVNVEDQAITLTLAPMSREQREAAFARILKPWAEAALAQKQP